MLLEQRGQSQLSAWTGWMVWPVVRSEPALRQNPCTSIRAPVPLIYSLAFGSISAYRSFIIKFLCCWEIEIFLNSHFTLCQLRCQNSEAGKTLEREGQERRRLGKRVSWGQCSFLPILPQSRAAHGLPPGPQHDLASGCQPSPFNRVSSTHVSGAFPTNSAFWSQISLLSGSFSLCLHTGRVIWVTL